MIGRNRIFGRVGDTFGRKRRDILKTVLDLKMHPGGRGQSQNINSRPFPQKLSIGRTSSKSGLIFRLKDCDVTWLYGPLQSQAGSLVRAHTEPTSFATSESNTPRRKMSRSSSFNTPSKPILKKRSYSEVMLTSLAGKTPGDLLSRAAQVVQDERRRELEEKEFREEQRKNPLTPIHVLRNQQRIRRISSTDLGSISRDSPESPFTVN